jgi:phospholipid N-methyltransferase
LQSIRQSTHLQKIMPQRNKIRPFRHPLLKLQAGFPVEPALFLPATKPAAVRTVGTLILSYPKRVALAFADTICERGGVNTCPDRNIMGEFSAEQALGGGTEAGYRAPTSEHPFMFFFREFLRQPAMVGSVIPSSRRTIEAMLSRVDWSRAKLFVEYGPGVGTFCETILERLAPDATLLVIDTNPAFIDYLRRKFADTRFIAVHGSAADVNEIIAAHGFENADYVLSGLPFSTLPTGGAAAIAEATHRALNPGGAFLIYQYSPYVLRFLEPLFDRIERDLEWWNIPPCGLFWAYKAAETE